MEKYYSISPYAYCAGNPVNLVDPEGKSTRVVANADGTYTVVGGDITDNDLSVYCGYFKDGDFVVDCVIGVTTTLTSFYDSDSGSWQNAIINLEDKSGIEFFETIINDRPSLMTYVFNAGNTRKYDFKSTNGSDSVVYNADQYYRGMPLGDGIITSARDIGNMVAGYMCGVNGIPYGASRLAFDLYQSYSDTKAKIRAGDSFPLTFSKEGDTTINAQRLGWRMGQIHRRMK